MARSPQSEMQSPPSEKTIEKQKTSTKPPLPGMKSKRGSQEKVESEFKETAGSNNSLDRGQVSAANQTMNSGFFSNKDENYMHEKLAELQQ